MATFTGSRPSVIPRLYAFDEDRAALYLHGAPVGETHGSVGEGAPVTLTVFEMGRLLPSDEALEFSVEYASVVIQGRVEVVEDEVEAGHGLRMLMEKYAPHLKAGRDYRPMTVEEVARTAVYRVDIESWSGKEKAEAPDFPGAYRFVDVR